MSATAFQKTLLKRIRWIVLISAALMVFWINRHYAFVRSDAQNPGMWTYAGQRLCFLERFDEESLPERGRVVLFIDPGGAKRMGVVLGWPGDRLLGLGGFVHCRGQKTILPVSGESLPSVSESHLLLAPDDPSVLKYFGPPMMPVQRIIGTVVLEL